MTLVGLGWVYFGVLNPNLTAAADGGLGPLLPSDTLKSMNLLDEPESPRESYTSEQPKQVTSNKLM